MFVHQTMFDGVLSPDISRSSRPLVDRHNSCVSPVIDKEFRHNIVIVELSSLRIHNYFDNVYAEIHDQQQHRRKKNSDWRQEKKIHN